MTLLLRHEDVADLLSPGEVFAALRGVLAEQAAGGVQLPPRTTTDSDSRHGWLRLMPAILNQSGVMGYKAMHSTPGVGVRYMVSLIDQVSGELLALVDADWITQQRTGSLAAIATDALARADARRIGVLGSSDQARSLFGAVAHLRRVAEVRVFSPTADNRARFARELSERHEVSSCAVATPEDAVREADIVLSAFRPGPEPVLRGAWLSRGTHVTAISSVRPEAREIDDEVWQRCSLVVVDDRDHALDSGDGRSAQMSRSVDISHVAELWEITSGRRSPRQSAADITLFKSVGTALQDLALAGAIYRRAVQQGIGQQLGNFPRPRVARARE